MPQIDYEKCNGCGICVSVCSCKALLIVDKVVSYDKAMKHDNCQRWCNNCELVCPEDAISCPFEVVFDNS